jgi:hypothetical protein
MTEKCDGEKHTSLLCKFKNKVVEGFIVRAIGANVIKLFTTVMYCHSMVIPSLCVIKLYGNYGLMAVIYHGKKFFYTGPL